MPTPHVRRASTWIAMVIAAAALTAFAGCSDDKRASETDPILEQMNATYDVYLCSTAIDTLDAAGNSTTFDKPALRAAALEYSDLTVKQAKLLAEIDYPEAAQPLADELQRILYDQASTLDLLSAVTVDEDAYPLVNRHFYDAAAFYVAEDELKAAIGQPVAQATVAADLLGLALQRAQVDDPTVTRLFDAAVAAKDLSAAKAANRADELQLQAYIDAVKAIDFPDQFDARAADLVTKIEAGIAFDRRQVDVPDTASIILTPDDGSPEFRAEQEAARSLIDDLYVAAPESPEQKSDPPKC